MTSIATTGSPSRFEAIASMVLGPIPVLSTLGFIAGVGSLVGEAWAFALFWALTALVAALTLSVLAGARPLPRLADQSHLLFRLSWLGRYATAAFLLCASTFLGGMAGTAVPAGSAGNVTDTLMLLVQVVGIYAAQIAIMILLVWLAIDVRRLGVDRRRAGFTRSIAYLAGWRVAKACDHPAVTRWLVALTSPLLTALVAATAVISILVGANASAL